MSKVTRSERAINDLRAVLVELADFDQPGQLAVIENVLRFRGYWSDADHDAAEARRARRDCDVPEAQRAYDGSNEPQKRQLTAQERDVLCRLLSDVLIGLERNPRDVFRVVRVFGDADVQQLKMLRFVLDPRPD